MTSNLHNTTNTLIFPDLVLNEGGWYLFQQTANLPALLWCAADNPSQTCSWLWSFHLFQKIVEVWKCRQRLEEFQRPQNVTLVIKAKRECRKLAEKRSKVFLQKNQIAFLLQLLPAVLLTLSLMKCEEHAGCIPKQTYVLGRWDLLHLMSQ